jgi:AcrR family transcriptional regulator
VVTLPEPVPDAPTDDATRPPAGGRAAETAARRRRLLEAATTLASEGGYDAVHMRAVAAQAGVALGTLYRHYASKDQLLVAVLVDQADALQHALVRRPARGRTSADRVADVLERACRALEREPRLTAAMVTALSSTDPAAASAVLSVEERLQTMMADAIDGATVPQLDAVLRTLGHVWFSAMVSWVAGKTDGNRMRADLDSAAHLLLA